MPFGTRNPSSYTPPTGVEVEPLDDEATCPVCGKDITEHNKAAGKVALAPCIVPKEPSLIHTQRAIFACNACYNTYRHNFFGCIEEFKDAVAAKRPRKARVVKSDVSNDHALEVLRKIYQMLRPLFEDVDEASRTKPQRTSVLSAGDCEIDFDDDLEAGMTPEQKARMEQAVIDAAARTEKVVIGG